MVLGFDNQGIPGQVLAQKPCQNQRPGMTTPPETVTPGLTRGLLRMMLKIKRFFNHEKSEKSEKTQRQRIFFSCSFVLFVV